MSVKGTLAEAKMCTFTLDYTHFIFNKCPIYTHDGASVKLRTNSQETDYSVGSLGPSLSSMLISTSTGTLIFFVSHNIKKSKWYLLDFDVLLLLLLLLLLLFMNFTHSIFLPPPSQNYFGMLSSCSGGGRVKLH